MATLSPACGERSRTVLRGVGRVRGSDVKLLTTGEPWHGHPAHGSRTRERRRNADKSNRAATALRGSHEL